MAKVDQALAKRLRQARELNRIPSAAEAARRLRIPVGTYSGHENGSRGVKRAESLRYARFFKVEPEWLIFGTGSPRGPGITDKLGQLDLERRREAERFIDFLHAQQETEKP